MTRDVSNSDRRSVLQGLAATGALALVGGAQAGEDDQVASDDHKHPRGSSVLTSVYRTYKPGVQDHFYTTNKSEKDNAVRNLGYRDEGVEWWAFNQEVAGTKPLYRLYKGGDNGNHFYTSSASERDNAHRNLGYKKEGVEGYLFKENAPVLSPVYRLYRGRDNDHFYTTSKSERDNAHRNLGYQKEGIVGYALTE